MGKMGHRRSMANTASRPCVDILQVSNRQNLLICEVRSYDFFNVAIYVSTENY